MSAARNRGRALVALIPLFLLVGVVASDVSGAQGRPPLRVSPAAAPSVADQVSAPKAATSRLAQTDQALLGRHDATAINVVIKFDYDSIATYAGGLRGLPATSPSVTGQALTADTASSGAYADFVAERERAIVAELQRQVPTATVGRSLRVVFGGVAARIPANAVSKVLAIAGVVAVQEDSLAQPLTDSSPEFINATAVYDQLGTTADAGEGLIYANLDTGMWPEHVSFADLGNLGAPPGPARECDFGDNPLTPAADPFVCNNKLIGGAPFLDTYLSDPGRAAAEPFHTARDSNGHGTHTGSTSAGNIVASAPVLGVERGPIHGLAPGAWVMTYKVCGIQGCFGSDSSAAVGQAILDGVDVINFSISGGTDPFSDPVELAFLDAYAAGVFVSASAGNEGPGAGTANHLGPWTTTVAASTQTREFATTLTVTSGADTFVVDGASIMPGAGPAPIVLASAAPYSNESCTAPAAAGTFAGKIVACQRGINNRVDKGYNVLQGGAVGMVLYNATLADTETDTHWLPAMHVANGGPLEAFLGSHPSATASFPAGAPHDGQGDVMAAFSSRGPGGLFIKPDITAPGVQILAGDTPIQESITSGPPGEYFQAIAGTSMSSPHVAGSAVLLLAVHPSWTPGQIKSALMTTAITDVVKEDLVTPADPFDLGAGRIDVGAAAASPLAFDETAANFFALGNDPNNAVQLNIPSINAPVMPGRLTTTRVATNVSGVKKTFSASASAPAGSTITVSPRSFKLAAGASQTLTITIESSVALGTQVFGQVSVTTSGAAQHLPVAFIRTQGDVSLTQVCDPSTIKQVQEESRCEITATNNSFADDTVDLHTTLTTPLQITAVENATQLGVRDAVANDVALAGRQPGVPSVDPGELFGYLPLDAFGITPVPVGDEDILNFNVPAYVFNGVTYDQLGVDSNGYLVAGGGSSEDNNCCNLPAGPDPARPNNMLAPFWTDLDGTGAAGVFAGVLTDGVNSWIVVEWRVNVFGTTDLRTFQVWLGIDGAQDITYAYDPSDMPTDPAGQDFLVGAENELGDGDVSSFLPTEDLRVTSSDPVAGASFTYAVLVRGTAPKVGTVTTEMTAGSVPGVTIVSSDITVTKKKTK